MMWRSEEPTNIRGKNIICLPRVPTRSAPARARRGTLLLTVSTGNLACVRNEASSGFFDTTVMTPIRPSLEDAKMNEKGIDSRELRPTANPYEKNRVLA